jgi:hypothetical protein
MEVSLNTQWPWDRFENHIPDATMDMPLTLETPANTHGINDSTQKKAEEI